MFAKLKKKIENEGGGLEGSKASPRRSESITSLSGIGTIGSSLHGKDGPSPPVSVTSEDPTIRDVSTSRDDLGALLQKKTEQCRKMEGNISDLAALIKDKSKTIEKLEGSLKQQDEVLAKKLQEQKEEFETYRNKLIEGYQTDKLKLDQEKKELKSQLSAAEEYQAKYFRKEEETDEMQGLTTQELSKVKHLLINTEQQLTKCSAELESKTHQCQVAETQVEKLTDEIGPMRKQLSVAESENERLKEETSERAELVTKLSKEKSAFEKRLDEINQELTKKQSQCNTLQSRLTDMEETHKTFIRNTDLQTNKSSKSLREKDDLIDTLKERVTTLEQRMADSSLSGDDRATALEAERNQLELKLSEVRQQLTEIKSTWSDKITQLEEQISHLNTKIAEDSEEISNHQKMTDQMRNGFEKQIEELKKLLQDAEKRALENFELASNKDSHYEKKLMELESKSKHERLRAKESEVHLRSQADSWQRQLSEYRADTDKKQDEDKDRITHLEKREIDLEALAKETEMKLKEIQTCLNQKDEEVRSMRNKMEEKEAAGVGQDTTISSLQKQVKELEAKCEKVVKERLEFEKHLRTSEDEKYGLLEKNGDLYRQMEALKMSETECKQEHQRTLTLKAEGDENTQKTESTLRKKIEALEKQIEQSEISKAESGLYSSRIDEMSDTISSLESQLADKNRMVKKQEQMLKDLRTTLQRELKVQALPGDDNAGDSNHNAASYSSSSSSPLSNRRAVDNPYRPEHQSSSSLTSSSSSPSIPTLPPSSNRLPSSHHHQHHHQQQYPYSNNCYNNSHPPYQMGNPPSPAVLPLDSSPYHTLMSSSPSVPSGASANSLTAHANYVKRDLEKDVNFQYLKHVVLKFMLSREAEAIQLIKAVSMLLNFSTHEQQLMKETLEWKMSWFGSRPPGGKGQTSKK